MNASQKFSRGIVDGHAHCQCQVWKRGDTEGLQNVVRAIRSSGFEIVRCPSWHYLVHDSANIRPRLADLTELLRLFERPVSFFQGTQLHNRHPATRCRTKIGRNALPSRWQRATLYPSRGTHNRHCLSTITQLFKGYSMPPITRMPRLVTDPPPSRIPGLSSLPASSGLSLCVLLEDTLRPNHCAPDQRSPLVLHRLHPRHRDRRRRHTSHGERRRARTTPVRSGSLVPLLRLALLQVARLQLVIPSRLDWVAVLFPHHRPNGRRARAFQERLLRQMVPQ